MEEPRGGRDLDEARVEAAPSVGGVLGHVDRSAAVLAAEGEPLEQPEEEQDEGREDADFLVRGDEANRGGARAHEEEREQEGILAADEIPQPPEYKRAEWQEYHQSVSQWEIDRYARLF